MQNPFIESVNERLRDELLNETLFSPLDQAGMALAIWRSGYNTSRARSQLGWRTPTEFAKTFPRRGQRCATHQLRAVLHCHTRPPRQIKPPDVTSKWINVGGKINFRKPIRLGSVKLGTDS